MKPKSTKAEVAKKKMKAMGKKTGPKNKLNKVVKRCFVKLGRINVDEAVEEAKKKVNKKPTAGGKPIPAKGRPQKILASVGLVHKEKVLDLVSKKNNTATPPSDNKSVKKTLKNIISGRDKALLKNTVPVLSKRTPKPNRRYMDDSVETKTKGKIVQDSDEDSDVDDDAEPTDSDSDFTDEIETPPVTRRSNQKVTTVKSEPPVNRKSQPSVAAGNVRSAPNTQKSATVASAVETKTLKKRKLDLDSSDAASPVTTKALPKKKFRKNLPSTRTDTDDESDNRNSPVLRVRKSNPVLNAIAARKSMAQTSMKSSKTELSNNQLDAKRSALSAALKHKLNTSAPAAPQTERIVKSSVTKSISANSTPLNLAKIINKKRTLTPIETKKIRKPVTPLISSVDLEDFEQMPTFTIVNINDIINQKEDMVVLEKKDKRKNVVRNEPDVVDYEVNADSTEEDDAHTNEDPKVLNRRKNQHTTILSEKIKSSQSAKSMPPKILNTKLASPVRPLKNVIKQNGVANKTAPRILNSTLCRNTGPAVEPRVLNDTLNNNNVAANNRSKENAIKTFANPRVGGPAESKPPQTKTVVTHQVMQGGTTRRVRKITCFETWFVIKLPAEEQPAHKAELGLSLLQLGNNISQVPLPSEKWSYTISLLRKKTKLNQSANPDDDLVYTGEVQDANINPDDRHLYVPSNVMFRRKSQNPTLRMQFDRAVILKNNTFYINIEGKNVKLLAAPTALQSLPDIETLLQIVNEVSLASPMVEQTSYVI